ncbi:unnamed protein product [Adineta steineri]|uniref:Peptidase S1 domain-containing protein n=1 Tax=Adineta steineri TaxID=433720 RepID=A0A819IHP2_9BILA|nr:unnamed protein product [Adineta steineri]
MTTTFLRASFVSGIIYNCNRTADCGCSRSNANVYKIVGGEDSYPLSWGWAVSLQFNFISGRHFCTGSILSPLHIITAAHCIGDDVTTFIETTNVVVGINRLSESEDPHAHVRSIIKVFSHPGYDNITNVHDIAVLLLNESLPISNEMNTARICLPRLETSDRNVTYPVNSASLVAIGWGLLKSDAPEIPSDQHLQQVTVASVSVDDPRCEEFISDTRFQFCAGVDGGGKDTCQGDSGGPLMRFEPTQKRWVLAGITSFGLGCADPRYSGVYTRVSAYRDWLRSVVSDGFIESLINLDSSATENMTAIVENNFSTLNSLKNMEISNKTCDTLTNEDIQAIESVYSYWFGENINTWSKSYPVSTQLWSKVNEQTDQEIRDKFEKYLIDATTSNNNLYQRWKTTNQGRLALIILFDQCPRNIYRNTKKMFEFDPLALKLSLEIINDSTYITTYSLPERLFIYFPLVHSEELSYTTKGANLMNDLVTQITQRDLRKRYNKNAQMAKFYQEIIELFGRYPNRNHFLERQSTIEEEKYLKTARNGFIKPVKNIKSTIENELPSLPTQSTSPLLKILVLHGFSQNANSLKRSAKKLFKGLKNVATFYFANGPLPCNTTGETKESLSNAFDNENMPETSYQRQWWNASTDYKTYHHLDVSLHYIDKLFKSEGPFDGIIGFSQGAALTGILCGLQPFGNITFNFAILISGFPSRAECHEQLMQPNSIKNIPSLHIYGTNDVLVTNDRTLQLADVFENSLVLSHLGGHFTPNTWPSTDIIQFLFEQQKCLSNKLNISQNPDTLQFQSLKTFEEKLKATIFFHQKQISNIPATERKNTKISITPIGLSKSFDQSNIETIINNNIDDYLLDDIMLLIWCERTTFHNSEPNDNDEKNPISLFFRHWILLYLRKSNEILSSYFNFIPKYGSWGDLKTLYLSVCQMENEFVDKKILLDNLKEECVKIFGEQLKHDYRIILNQPDELANEQEEQMNLKNQEWISNCAKEAPRLASNRNNLSTIMAKAIAKYMRPIIDINNKTEKGYVYQMYRRLISDICHVLKKASPTYVDEQVRLRTRRDRAFQYTKEQREQLLNAPPSAYITNPEPEPVVPCSLQDLQPLLEHLILNKPGPDNDNQSIVFSRGTIMTGGRLDLCKQVVGPKGIQPLLDAMKNSSVVNRILLGNNIVGLPGAQAISQYIRFNIDSNIDTWYIAGNNFDGECMSLICEALATDTKVKALWLKRNPILPSGVIHIAQMLTTNHYLQTLDLLNTGLLDEGCEILFNSLKLNQTLKHLYLDTNGLTVKSGRIIRLYFEQNENHLESLYLSCNALGDAGTCEIAAGLKHDKHLKRLGLASNCIGVDGARALVDVLIDHTSLVQLNLGYMKATILLGGLDNVIGDEGAIEISRLIRSNQHIRSIDLTFNGISQKGLIQLKDALKQNQTLTTLKILQFGQVLNELTKEEINTKIEQNKIEWGKQILNNDTNYTNTPPTKSECLKKGQQLNDEINFPEHVMEIISYYRTH